MKSALVCMCLFSLVACNWVKPDAGSEAVSLVKAAHVEECEKLGDISVSVKDKVAGMGRKTAKVARELVVLAKNQAVSMEANALVSSAEPVDGKQMFAAYKCEVEN
jgi:hypothetical protein